MSNKIKLIIEALLMISQQPLTTKQLFKLLLSENQNISFQEVATMLGELGKEYENKGIELKEVASGWRFQLKPEFGTWATKLSVERPLRYSKAFLETLAIIAYRQPVTRMEIEDLRGVAVSSNIIRALFEFEWIKVAGHKEVPGRPELLATTKNFLDYFNLKSLAELPELADFKEQVSAIEEPSRKEDEQVVGLPIDKLPILNESD